MLSLSRNSLFCRHRLLSPFPGYLNISKRCSILMADKFRGRLQIAKSFSGKVNDSNKKDEKSFKNENGLKNEIGLKSTSPWNVANGLSVFRIAASPFICGFLLIGSHKIALGLFTVAAITDFLDGFVARRYGLQSVLGAALDPLGDKVLMISVSTCLWGMGQLPGLLVSSIVIRDLALIGAAVVQRNRLLEANESNRIRENDDFGVGVGVSSRFKLFKAFFDPAVVPMRIKPLLSSKINTTLQLILLTLIMANLALPNPPEYLLWLLSHLQNIVLVSTLYTAMVYPFCMKDVFVVIKK